MKSYPVCGLDHDWTHRSTLNKENYSNTNQIRNSSGLSSQFCYMIRCIIFRWGNFEVEKFDPAVDFGVFETGRVKISSSICSLCFFFWGSMKKYIHIHIWFIWYCNWICNTQVLYTYIYQESSAIKCRWEYLIHREKHIPYEYIIKQKKQSEFVQLGQEDPQVVSKQRGTLVALFQKKVSAMRNGVKFDATPSLPKIGVVCLVKGKVGALKSEDSLFFFGK